MAYVLHILATVLRLSCVCQPPIPQFLAANLPAYAAYQYCAAQPPTSARSPTAIRCRDTSVARRREGNAQQSCA